ncbi:MAG: histidinol phosphatase [SAR86 cluster bacterium]|uniref:Histidinol-phosphatase n=1 Tax=SAR86 cluster bacterium TaxID=2030880 RepID=A0A2A5CIK0_9GAMM|nr:MAG: histidinol phosphatase [SAR86 cluster bacterium]
MNKGLEKIITKAEKVSVHGGHSGQFCQHAQDNLESIVKAYIDQGFTWVGITEHIPPLTDNMRYPDEVKAELSAEFLQQRFVEYFQLGRELQKKYANQIELLLAFEIETYAGTKDYVHELIKQFQPDYLVGSLHHVNGLGIDYDKEYYQQALAEAGSMRQLYCDYFDSQYQMMQEFCPAVVAHFDLIRVFDPDYLSTLADPEIINKIERNLDFIAENKLIMDFNLRGFDKGLEQYPSLSILKKAMAKGIALVPGDDSHGVNSVGRNYDQGVVVLTNLGASLQWQKPALIRY